VSRAAVLGVRREREEFEATWAAWLAGELGVAMRTPLPKGWVATPNASAEGGLAFLNTRTGGWRMRRVACSAPT